MAVVSGALAMGLASALLPVVNAEIAVAAAVRAAPNWLIPVVVAFAVGQTLGKLAYFELAFRQAGRPWPPWKKRSADATSAPPKQRSRWQEKSLAALNDRWAGNGVVALSATLGLPPLAVVSVLAGALKRRRLDFAVCCFAGRVVRFLALGLSVEAL